MSIIGLAQRLSGLTILVLLLVLLSSCERRSHEVRYVVTGTATRIGVTYVNASGGQEQRDVTTGWDTRFTVETWERVVLTVFNKSTAGTVGCKLYVDGRLVQEAESEGGFTFARCAALAGAEPTPTP
ncbi:MAG: hypothetical protein HC822_16020 [Oscillochloris sp.]|nr:hypothetical protein [Oscillochloris sp.]